MTSIDIDPELLMLAKEMYGVRTNREAIDRALRDVVQRRRQLEAIEYFTSLDLDPDPQRIEYPMPGDA
ncbi:type II toxin-antitoxin system VapB family antitoxin [Microbacteriaceae bacterium VKM Ac-2854]|nr:type II toxin-antitoxin system VapB family antitoxin [Microbacteriaceae bacterium VKM Ac-2854]